MFSKLWCARVCYAIFLGSKNATLHSKIEHTANHFTVIQTLRVSKSTFSLIEIILKVHIHLSMTHRVSRMQNQEIKNFSTTHPSPNVRSMPSPLRTDRFSLEKSYSMNRLLVQRTKVQYPVVQWRYHPLVSDYSSQLSFVLRYEMLIIIADSKH